MIGKSAIFPTIFFTLAIHFTGCSGTGVEGGSSEGGGNRNGNTAPVADAKVVQNENVKSGTLVTLDGSHSADTDGDLLTYQWLFVSKPNASSAILSNPTIVSPTFTADVVGEYVLQLIVNDERSDSIPAVVTITASQGNVRPTAQAGPDQNVKVGDDVLLDGKSSIDANNDKLVYEWAILREPQGDPTATTLLNPKGPEPSFTAKKPGEYELTLEVSDGKLKSQLDSVVIRVNGAPTVILAECTRTITNTKGEKTCERIVIKDTKVVNLDGAQSNDPNGDQLSYQWFITSVDPSTEVKLDKPTEALASFEPPGIGTYVFRLDVSDGKLTSSGSLTVKVTDQPEAVLTKSTESILMLREVTVDGSQSKNADANGFIWALTPPGSESPILQDAVKTNTFKFTPEAPGKYTVGLQVVDSAGNKSIERTIDITAKTVLVKPVSSGPVSVCSDIKLSAEASNSSNKLIWTLPDTSTVESTEVSFLASNTTQHVVSVRNAATGEADTVRVSVNDSDSSQGTVGHRVYHYGPDNSDNGTTARCDGAECPLDCEKCHQATPHDKKFEKVDNLLIPPDLSGESMETIKKKLTDKFSHPGGKARSTAGVKLDENGIVQVKPDDESLKANKKFECLITQLSNFLAVPAPTSDEDKHEGVPTRPLGLTVFPIGRF